MKLGDAVQSIDFAESEMERISSLIRTDENLNKILRKESSGVFGYLIDKQEKGIAKNSKSKKEANRTIRNMHTDLGIHGIPAPKRAATILRNLSRNLTSKQFKGKFSRDFYEECLAAYFINNHPELQKLLLNEDCEEKLPPEKIFSLIIQKSTSYSVPKDSLRVLYLYWWFERSEELEKQLENDNEIDHILSITRDLQKEIESMKGELEKINETSSSSSDPSELKIDKEAIEKIINEKTKSDSSVEELKAFIEGVRDDSASRDSVSQIQNSINSAETKIKKLQNNLKLLKDSVPEQIEKSEKDMRKKIREELEGEIAKVHEKYTAEIETINERLLKTIDSGKRDLLEMNGEVFTHKVFTQERKQLAQEEILINAWQAHMSQNYGKHVTLDEAAAYHTIFKSLSYVVVEDKILCKSWVEVMGMEDRTCIENSSPLWVSRLDWLGLSVHLEQAGNQLFSGIVSDFDTGVVEAYLLPTLKKWLDSKKNTNQKLFLVPSASKENAIDYSSIFSVAGKIPSAGLKGASLKVNLSDKGVFRIDQALPVISYSKYKGWIEEHNPSEFRRVMIEIPFERDKIKIAEDVLGNFSSLMNNLDKYFKKNDAFRLAYNVVVKPFVEANYAAEALEKHESLAREFLLNE